MVSIQGGSEPYVAGITRLIDESRVHPMLLAGGDSAGQRLLMYVSLSLSLPLSLHGDDL